MSNGTVRKDWKWSVCKVECRSKFDIQMNPKSTRLEFLPGKVHLELLIISQQLLPLPYSPQQNRRRPAARVHCVTNTPAY